MNLKPTKKVMPKKITRFTGDTKITKENKKALKERSVENAESAIKVIPFERLVDQFVKNNSINLG